MVGRQDAGRPRPQGCRRPARRPSYHRNVPDSGGSPWTRRPRARPRSGGGVGQPPSTTPGRRTRAAGTTLTTCGPTFIARARAAAARPARGVWPERTRPEPGRCVLRPLRRPAAGRRRPGRPGRHAGSRAMRPRLPTGLCGLNRAGQGFTSVSASGQGPSTGDRVRSLRLNHRLVSAAASRRSDTARQQSSHR